MKRPTPPWPERPALFLDLDGTLLEFAGRPQEVAPSARLRAVLPTLVPATNGAVAIVTGRKIADIDRLLEPHRFPAAGVHGLELRASERHAVATQGDEAALGVARDALAHFVAAHSGLLLEDKDVAVALHYRGRPELADEIAGFVTDLEAVLTDELDILRGKMVVEIKLSGSNKGQAIRTFMEEPPFRGRRPVFIGDDVTDEAGFEAVNALDGVSVKVGDGPTVARWRLADVTAVVAWLETVLAGAPEQRGIDA